MNVDKIAEYARLRRKQKEMSAAHDAVKERADDLERELLDEFASSGLQKMSLADGTTVFLHSQLWAKVAPGSSSSEVVEALKLAGQGHMVSEKYNANTLSAFVRDLDREGAPLPPELDGKVAVARVFSLRTRLSG